MASKTQQVKDVPRPVLDLMRASLGVEGSSLTVKEVILYYVLVTTSESKRDELINELTSDFEYGIRNQDIDRNKLYKMLQEDFVNKSQNEVGSEVNALKPNLDEIALLLKFVLSYASGYVSRKIVAGRDVDGVLSSESVNEFVNLIDNHLDKRKNIELGGYE